MGGRWPNSLYYFGLVMMMYSNLCTAAGLSCTAVQQQYHKHGFKDPVPKHPIPGDHLNICSSSGETCCTETMEGKLGLNSREEFDNRLQDLILPFSNLFSKKHLKFDESFKYLLNYSHSNFDSMFHKTYGVLYVQNSDVFDDLYTSLENYYTEGKLDLATELHQFFTSLYRKMFTVLNFQYQFSDEYLDCVTRYMQELRPFGDVPQKLTVTIKRSFVALRTFVQGLATAAEVGRNVVKVNPSITCIHELMKMSHCSTCDGLQGVKPCQPYCIAVQNHCLHHHQPLVQQWTKFVDAMVKLGYRLESPFNIENVVEPINIKVSDAIMNFQEAGAEISKKVFLGCGQLKLAHDKLKRDKLKRDTHSGEIPLESLNFSSTRARGGSHWDASGNGETTTPTIAKLVREIKTKIKNSVEFWEKLPEKMCEDARHHGAAECWTGTKLGKYKGGDLDQYLKKKDPMMSHSPAMDEQVFRLKLITSKLEEAYNGRDVSWIDEEWLRSSTPDPRSSSRHSSAEEKDDSLDDGSGSGAGFSHDVGGPHYPPDDEDAPTSGVEGSGDEIHDYDSGSGDWDTVHQNVYDSPSINRDDGPRSNDNNNNNNNGGRKSSTDSQPPSSAPKDSMSLCQALTVYLLPAIIIFLGSIS